MLREIRCSLPNDKQVSLRMKRELLNGQGVRLQAWENSVGDLFILLNTVVSSERVMVDTTEDLLMDFFSNQIALGDLVYYSPSPFALLIKGDKVVRLYLPDADVELAGGQHYYYELSHARVEEEELA